MRKQVYYLIGLCLVFVIYFILNESYFSGIYNFFETVLSKYPVSFFLTYLTIGIPILLFVFFTNSKQLLTPLGLNKNIIKGLVISFIFSLPMLIGYGIQANFKIEIDGTTFWFMCVFAAFFEEFYYRGFFFGLIFKKTALGFLPSIIVSALVFASLHLYQSDNLTTLVGIFITTFLGAGLFAWLYVEWDYNLWVPIGLHFFMNLSWELFSISDNALGDLNANLIRGITILFAIVGTLIYKKKKQLTLEVNNRTLI